MNCIEALMDTANYSPYSIVIMTFIFKQKLIIQATIFWAVFDLKLDSQVITSQIASCRPQRGPMLAPWTSLSGLLLHNTVRFIPISSTPLIPYVFRNHHNTNFLLNITFTFEWSHCSPVMTAAVNVVHWIWKTLLQIHDGVIKWKHFPRNCPLVRGIHWSPVNSPHKGQWLFDVFFDLRLNKRLSKQSWGWWFETISRPLWRHCNAKILTRGKQVKRASVIPVPCFLSWVGATNPALG